jgi:hypothetical protein
MSRLNISSLPPGTTVSFRGGEYEIVKQYRTRDGSVEALCFGLSRGNQVYLNQATLAEFRVITVAERKKPVRKLKRVKT